MTSTLRRRLERLEAARRTEGGDDERVELPPLPAELKEGLRRLYLDLGTPPEEVARLVDEPARVPRSQLEKPPDPEVEARIQAWLEDYRRRNPPRPAGGDRA